MGFLTSLQERYQSRRDIRALQQKIRAHELRAYSQLLEGSFNASTEQVVDTEQLVEDLLNTDGSSTVSLEVARRESQKLYRVNSHARNLVQQTMNFVVGRGFGVTFSDDALQERWQAFSLGMRWALRRRSMLKRIMRDGEALLRKFPQADAENAIRFVEPAQVVAPGGREEAAPQGVLRDPRDAETIQGYYIDGELIDAAEVFHFKDLDSEFTAARGWPILYDARDVIQDYERYVKTRAMLNRFRASVMMFRKHTGKTTTQLEAFQSAIKDGTLTKPGGRSEAYQTFGPGKVVDHNENVDYEFKSPNLGSADAAIDGRNMSLLIAVYFQLPEFWATGDASNGSYASTAVAENPGILAMQAVQELFGAELLRFLKWAMDLPEETEASITYPNIVYRDEAKQTTSNLALYAAGAMTKRTLQERSGLDPGVEEAGLVDEESKLEPFPEIDDEEEDDNDTDVE